MRILINTVCFYPGIGGLETMNMILCKTFANHGHEVVVIAPEYKGLDYDDSIYPFKILREPSAIDIFKEYLKCDVFFHRQLSLKAIWPLLAWPFKKWVCSYHMCEFNLGTQSIIIPSLKYFFSRFPHNITVSHTVAKYLKMPSAKVIYNAYNDELFKDKNVKNRTGFVFVGRLAPAKGCDLLIKAFYKFCQNNPHSPHCNLTIIGTGKEDKTLRQLAKELDVENKIHFCGSLTGEHLVNEINNHYCQVIPSTYREAFGIVALESLACGCITITSDGDGLAEAIGGCGFTFNKNDLEDLTKKMEVSVSLTEEEVCSMKAKGQERCSLFTPEKVATRYEEFLALL